MEEYHNLRGEWKGKPHPAEPDGGFVASGGAESGGTICADPFTNRRISARRHGNELWVFDLYWHGARAHRQQGFVAGGGKRGVVVGLSDSAASRMLWTATNHPEPWVQWGRLGYPSEYPHDGRTCKRHLRALRERLRRRYPSLAWLWVFEFQQRGAPHFHFLFDQEVDGEWLARAWYEIVGSGDQNHLCYGTWLEAIRSEVAVARYLGKYLAKQEQKELPPDFLWPGRFWGCGRGVAPLCEKFTADAKAAFDITRAMRRYETGPRRGLEPSLSPSVTQQQQGEGEDSPGSHLSQVERRRKRERRFSGQHGWSSWRGGRHVLRLATHSCVRLM